MRKILTIVLAAFVLSGCADKKAQQKAVLDSIITIHDKVMGSEEQLMKNKMKLDTLLKQTNLPGKDTATLVHTKLVSADNVMDNWMHKFDPEHKGKTDDETISYFEDQKKQVMTIDSQITTAVKESNQYLLKVKTK